MVLFVTQSSEATHYVIEKRTMECIHNLPGLFYVNAAAIACLPQFLVRMERRVSVQNYKAEILYNAT